LTYNKKVISSDKTSAGLPWRFFDFVQGKANPIEAWYQNDLSEGAQFLFDDLLKNIRNIENPFHWTCFRHFMKGKLKHERVWELGFQSDGRQYRVLAKFGPKRTVVFLIGCYHKGSVYTPSDALEQAFKRSRNLARGEATVLERTVEEDF
jgi:hypothetical protein